MAEVKGKYEEIKGSVERLRSGELTIEEFQEYLINTYDSMVAKGDDLRAFFEEESEYAEESSDEVETGLEGVDLYITGLQEMSFFLEDGDETHLDAGLEMLSEGNDKINEAISINRKQREENNFGFLM